MQCAAAAASTASVPLPGEAVLKAPAALSDVGAEVHGSACRPAWAPARRRTAPRVDVATAGWPPPPTLERFDDGGCSASRSDAASVAAFIFAVAPTSAFPAAAAELLCASFGTAPVSGQGDARASSCRQAACTAAANAGHGCRCAAASVPPPDAASPKPAAAAAAGRLPPSAAVCAAAALTRAAAGAAGDAGCCGGCDTLGGSVASSSHSKPAASLHCLPHCGTMPASPEQVRTDV